MRGSRKKDRSNHTRQQIAHTAAQIMIDEQLEDYGRAKRKAMERLKLPAECHQPTNQEVQEQIDLQLRLYRDTDSLAGAANLKTIAAQVRQLFQGGLLLRPDYHSERALPGASLQLHLLDLPLETAEIQLLEEGIPHELGSKWIRVATGQSVELPALRLQFGDTRIEVVFFQGKTQHLVPLSTTDGKPVRRVEVR